MKAPVSTPDMAVEQPRGSRVSCNLKHTGVIPATLLIYQYIDPEFCFCLLGGGLNYVSNKHQLNLDTHLMNN